MRRGEFLVWIGTGLLFIGVCLWVILGPKGGLGREGKGYSSYHTSPEGTRALFTLISNLGYSPIRRHEPLSLLKEGDLLFVIGERLYFKRYEIRSILAWIRRGGILVLASPNHNTLLEKLGVRILHSGSSDKKKARLIQASLYGARSREILIREKGYFRPLRSDYLIHYKQDDRPVVVSIQEGQGRAILISDTYPFTNEGIKDGANTYFITNLFRAERDVATTVQFDEYRHGYRFERTIVGYLKHRSVHFLLPQVVLILLLYLILKGSRFGQVIPITPKESYTSITYPKALGTIYYKAGRRNEIFEPIYHDFRDFLTTYLRVPANLEIDELVEKIKGRLREPDRLLELLKECEEVIAGRFGKLSRDKLLELTRALTKQREEILHGDQRLI